jgi:hypothetical protein
MLPTTGYRHYIVKKGQGSVTLEVENIKAAREWNVNILAFPLVDIEGKIPKTDPIFQVWETKNGKNKNLSKLVSYFDKKVPSFGPFWKLKVGNFDQDMVIFTRIQRLGFIAVPEDHELGCVPKPVTWEEGHRRGCW